MCRASPCHELSNFVKAGMSILTDNKLKLNDVLDNRRVSEVCLAVDQEDLFRLHEFLDPLRPKDIVGFFGFVGLASWILL
tara:strand:- start:289 stop:528 length:240 start_codon:yes stop_codon:yes gene_type:complete